MAARRAAAEVARLFLYSRLGGRSVSAMPSRHNVGYQQLAPWRLLRGYSTLPAHTKLAMPALSPTMTQGNVRPNNLIAKWYVKVGDEIAAGTVLADIETDKATLAFENQEDGYIAAITKPEGSRDVPVGETVAIVVEEASDVAAFANYSGDSAAAPAPAAAPAAHKEPAPPAGAGGSYPEYIPLQMPALSPTMEQGNIVSWQVKEGDEVSAGTVLAEIETDKATLAFENQDDGYLAKILAPAGSRDIKVGQLVAIIVEEQSDVAAFANFTTDGAAATSAPKPAAGAPAADSTTTAAAAAKPAVPKIKANSRLGPAARVALLEAGLTADDISNPSGPNNIITKADVLAAVAAGVKHGAAAAPAEAAPAKAADRREATQPAAAASQASSAPQKAAAAQQPSGPNHQDIPNTQVRQIIAKRLLESKLTAPSLYVTADVSLTQLEQLRETLKAAGSKVSVNDFVMRAAALALRDVPEANAFWDSKAGAAVKQPSVDVCVAVATEGGLITPIVKGADSKGLMHISAEVKELAAKARANKLQPPEFMGGTFTISNLGMYGLSNFSAIINPPQAAIMAIGGSQKKVVLDSGLLVSSSYMTVTLTADHRVYDGELATRLLDAFKGYMENPLRMLL